MLDQIISLKKFFSWKELLSNAKAMKMARGPLRGYVTTVCFWALMEIGLLEPLASQKKLSLQEFAKTHQLNEEILFYICRYLSRISYLSIHGDELSLSRKGEKFWAQTQSVFRLFHAYEPIFSSLIAQLKNEVTFGKNLSRREAEVAQGFSELGNIFMFPILEKIILQEGFHSIIDLGCAELELSTFICKYHPEFKCVGIDASSTMVEMGKKKIQEHHLESQIKILSGDMFQIDKIPFDFSPYEVVTATDLFHGYFSEGEEKLLSLFKKLKQVLPRQALLISEICLPPKDQMKRIAYPNVEHELFHDLTKQKSFAEGELESLLERSGWKLKKSWNLNKIAGRVCLLAI